MSNEAQKNPTPRDRGFAAHEQELQQARPGLKFVKPDARDVEDQNELSETLSRLEVGDMLAPFRALAENIMANASRAANNMAAQIAHLRDTADAMQVEAEALLAKARDHSEGIVQLAQDMQASEARCRSAIALAHQARTGASAD